MPYALFSQNVKISQSYATRDEVWTHAVESGLVVDCDGGEPTDDGTGRQALDSDYEIRHCVGEDHAQPGDRPSAAAYRKAG